jgi:hypothetical protein
MTATRPFLPSTCPSGSGPGQAGQDAAPRRTILTGLAWSAGLVPWSMADGMIRPFPQPATRGGRCVSDHPGAGVPHRREIKLSVVVSDIFGVSGRQMLAALIGGQRDPKALAQLARSVMRGKITQRGTTDRGPSKGQGSLKGSSNLQPWSIARPDPGSYSRHGARRKRRGSRRSQR